MHKLFVSILTRRSGLGLFAMKSCCILLNQRRWNQKTILNNERVIFLVSGHSVSWSLPPRQSFDSHTNADFQYYMLISPSVKTVC